MFSDPFDEYIPPGYISVAKAAIIYLALIAAKVEAEEDTEEGLDERVELESSLRVMLQTHTVRAKVGSTNFYLRSPPYRLMERRDFRDSIFGGLLMPCLDDLRRQLSSSKITAYCLRSDGPPVTVPTYFWNGSAAEDVLWKDHPAVIELKDEDVAGYLACDTGKLEQFFVGCELARPTPQQEEQTGATSSGAAIDSQTRETSPAPRSVGGRPRLEWNDIWLETLRKLYIDGPPERQAKLVEHLQLWYAAKFLEEPGVSTLKRHVSRVWKELKLDEKDL